MTAVERRPDPPAGAELRDGAASLVSWAQEADAAYELARRLTDTSFCPQQFRGKPAEAAAAMLAGAEVGLSPLAALRSFDIIQGQAAPRALTLRAVAQAHGCEFITVSESATKVEMRARRSGQSEWETVVWTMDRARGLALDKKDNWRRQPQAMLVARATAELARRVAADAILGLAAYAAEELDDDTPPTSGKRTVRRTQTPAAAGPELPAAPAPTYPTQAPAAAKTPAAAGLPPLPGEDDAAPVGPDPPPPSEPPGLISAPQLRMLHALLREADLADRDLGLAFIGDVIGREIESSKDLSKGEASTVIDRLNAVVEVNRGMEDEPDPGEFLDGDE